MKHLRIATMLSLLALGCRPTTVKKDSPITRIYELESCKLLGLDSSLKDEGLPCPDGEIDIFWVQKAFGIPKLLSPKNAFCMYDWLKTASHDLDSNQIHMPIEMLGTLRTGDSVFKYTYDDNGNHEKYSFDPQESKPTTRFNLVRDQDSHIGCIHDGRQRVEYDYDGQNICEIREFLNGNMVQIISIR